MKPTRLFLVVVAVFAGFVACRGSRIRIITSVDYADYQHRQSKVDSVSLDLQSSETLVLVAGYGSIDVRVSSTEEPKVEADITIAGRTDDEARALLEQLELRKERTSQGLKVWVEGDPIRVAHERHHRTTKSVIIHAKLRIRAVVPPKTRLHARSSAGSILARGPLGFCDLHTKYGEIGLTDVEGGATLKSQSGSLSLERSRGGKVELDSSYGSIRLAKIQAELVRAETSSGNIQANDIRAEDIHLLSSYGKLELADLWGDLIAKTSSGSITLARAARARLVLDSGYGGVSVMDAAGDIDAKSSSGTIRIKNFRGAVVANSSYGGVAVEGVLTSVSAKSSSGHIVIRARHGSAAEKDWELSSGYGKILLALPSDFSADVSAKTGYGYIETELPIKLTGRIGQRYTLKGQLGSGGPTIRLKTSSGSILLQKSAEPVPTGSELRK